MIDESIVRQRFTSIGKTGIFLILLGPLVYGIIESTQNGYNYSELLFYTSVLFCGVIQFTGMLMIFIGREYYKYIPKQKSTETTSRSEDVKPIRRNIPRY